jgi:hypothetical protein
MRGGLDEEYVKGLEKKSTAELEEELKAVTDSRATASSDQLDEIDKKEMAVSNALTAAIEKETATPTVEQRVAARQKEAENAAARREQERRAQNTAADVRKNPPLKQTMGNLPGLLQPLPKPPAAGRRRRSRKTRRYARRTR